MKRRAIYPGSFDPPTYGHVDIIRRSLQLTDEVIVAVVYNPQKDNYLFTPQERLDMFREELQAEGDRVVYDSFHGLLVKYVEKMQANIIIRGLRAASDFEYEFQMTLMNRQLNNTIETVFLMPSEQYSFLSSSLVKEVASFGGDVSHLVPKSVAEALARRLSNSD